MTESRLAATTLPAWALPLGALPPGRWRDVVGRCAREAGPFPAALVEAWQGEIDAVEARIDALECAAGYLPGCLHGLEAGVHALVALASPRRAPPRAASQSWAASRLVDLAAAVELAYRATRHHDQVRDAASSSREENRRHVLDGDWSITQAAVLAADAGPRAYRLLVRGYGAAQLGRLGMVATPALLATAAALGALAGGIGDPAGDSAVDPAIDPAVDLGRPDSTALYAARVLAWAQGIYASGGTANSTSRPLPAPTSAHASSTSITTSPAGGRPAHTPAEAAPSVSLPSLSPRRSSAS